MMNNAIYKRIKTLSAGAALATASLLAGQANAQEPAIAYPVNNWSYLDHSSTLAEGVARGDAAIISAAGQTVYMDSIAAINYQEAFRRALDNSVAISRAYYEHREIREEYLKKYGPKPFIGEARRKFIEYYAPKRFSAQEYNSQTGEIYWPHILRQEQFAPVKEQIDKIFEARTVDNSGDGSATHREIASLVKTMDALLKDNISKMTSDQYLQAKEFLRSVELEGRNVVPVSLEVAPASLNSEEKAPTEKKADPEEPITKVNAPSGKATKLKT